MNRYNGIKTRGPVSKTTPTYAIQRLGTTGWVGLILLVFMVGAICGIFNARFGGF